MLARDGKESEMGFILGRKVECDGLQDTEAFLKNSGRKGRQSAVITACSYQYVFV